MLWLLFIGVIFAASIQPSGYYLSSTNLVTLNISGQNCFLHTSDHWFYEGNNTSLTLWLPNGIYNLTLECDDGRSTLNLEVNSSQLYNVPVINETTIPLFVLLPTSGTCEVENQSIRGFGYIIGNFSNQTLIGSCGEGYVRVVPSITLTLLGANVSDLSYQNISVYIEPVVVGGGYYITDHVILHSSSNTELQYPIELFDSKGVNITVNNSANISVREEDMNAVADFGKYTFYNSTVYVYGFTPTREVYAYNSFVVLYDGLSVEMNITAENSTIFLFAPQDLSINATNTTFIFYNVSRYKEEGSFYLVSYNENLSSFSFNRSTAPIILKGKDVKWEGNGSLLLLLSENITLINLSLVSLKALDSSISLIDVKGEGGAPVGFYSENSSGRIENTSFCNYANYDVYSLLSNYNVTNLTCDLSYGISCNSSCELLPGYKGSAIVKVPASLDMENVTVLVRYLPDYISSDICEGAVIIDENQTILPTQILDCTGPSALLFQANLTEGNNTFKLMYGNNSSYQPIFTYIENASSDTSISLKKGGREIDLDGRYEITLNESFENAEISLILEDFFKPGNNISFYVGNVKLLSGYVDQEGKLIATTSSINTTITSPGPLWIRWEDGKLYLGLEGRQYGYSSLSASGIPKLVIEGKGKIWIKRFFGANNVYTNSYIVYKNPPRIPFTIVTNSSGLQSFAFYYDKIGDLERLGLAAPYYQVEGYPTLIRCEDRNCYGGFEGVFSPGSHTVYLIPTYASPPQPSLIEFKPSSLYFCPNAAEGIFYQNLEQVSAHWGDGEKFPSSTISQALSYRYLYPEIETGEILRISSHPGYRYYLRYALAFFNQTLFSYRINNVPVLGAEGYFPNPSFLFQGWYGYGEAALCFEKMGSLNVSTIPIRETYRTYYGNFKSKLWNNSEIDIVNGTFYLWENSPLIVYTEVHHCQDCVFENTSLANINISANSVIVTNVTLYGYLDINTTNASLYNIKGYGYSGTIKRGHGQGPGKGVYAEAYYVYYAKEGTGASHGGFGGRSNVSVAWAPYGSLTQPQIGSSGAGSYYDKGGVGGGLIIVRGSQAFLANISLAGEDSNAGAGAGGGVLLIGEKAYLENVSVKGGDALIVPHGAGGGGRIALIASETTFAEIDASGGQAPVNFSRGGPGTFYISNSSGNFLIIDNKGKITPNQAYIDQPINGEIWIINGAYAEQKTPYINASTIYILNNSVLSHIGYPWKLPLNITFETMHIDENSQIDVTYKGVNPHWDVLTDEIDLSPNFKSATDDVLYASRYFGGTIILNGKDLYLNGTISADAGIGYVTNITSFGFADGSAGKIFLNIENLAGNGNISANENDACGYDAWNAPVAMGYIYLNTSLENYSGSILYYPTSDCNTRYGTYKEMLVGSVVSWGGINYPNNGSLVLVGNGRDKTRLDNYSLYTLIVGHPEVRGARSEIGTILAIGNNVSFVNLLVQNATLTSFNYTEWRGERLIIREGAKIKAKGIASRGIYNSTTRLYCGVGPYPSCNYRSRSYPSYYGYRGPGHGGLGSIELVSNHTFNALYYSKVYDSIEWPTQIGSTAPCYGGYYSGGALVLNFTWIENNGTISASGGYATSGGSLILIGNMTNNGRIEANGGNSTSSCRALGGGGRIAIYYDQLVPGEIEAIGGQDPNNYIPSLTIAGAGTIYLYNLNTGEKNLLIKNAYPEYVERNTSSTPLPTSFDAPIYVENATVSLWNTTQHLPYLNLTNSILTHPPYPLSLSNYINLTVETFIMDENSSVNVTGLGYGPAYDSNILGPGGASLRGGAGYGGKGGDAGYSYPGGPTYGVLTNPIYLGSDGGYYSDSYPGGAGGGLIILWANQAILGNFSSFDASGQSVKRGYSDRAGAGSGGSILLFLKNASGIVYTLAKGGDSRYGGSGGGGRIAIYLGHNNSFDVAYNVSQGDAYYSSREGQPGTFYMGPYYYLEAISLPSGPFNISDIAQLQVDLKVWNGTDFESYDAGQVWMYHKEEESVNITSGETIPARLDFSYVGYYEGNLTFRKAGKKNYVIYGSYGHDFPLLSLPYNAEVYGWYINMSKDKRFYIPASLALVHIQAYYYPTYDPYVGNISFYYKGTLLESTFINNTYLLIFNVGNEAGFHELVAHID